MDLIEGSVEQVATMWSENGHTHPYVLVPVCVETTLWRGTGLSYGAVTVGAQAIDQLVLVLVKQLGTGYAVCASRSGADSADAYYGINRPAANLTQKDPVAPIHPPDLG